MWAAVGLALVALAAIGAALWLAVRRTEARIERDLAAASAERARERNATDAEIARLSDADLDERLRRSGL